MKILFIDLETTDLLHPEQSPIEQQPKIIEIYAELTDDKYKTLKTIDTLVNPGVNIPDFITRITHIDNTMVSMSPFFVDIDKKLTKLIKSADRIVAHNLPFDWTVLKWEYARIGSKLPKKDLYCTVEQSIHIAGFRLRLQELHKRATGLDEIPGAHRAKNDVEAMIECYKYLQENGNHVAK